MKISPALPNRNERLSPTAAAAILQNPPSILNVPEAAALLRISVRTLREHVSARRLPVCRLGGRLLFRREALLSALDRATVQAIE
jgi:excisionase family DNA binding protein